MADASELLGVGLAGLNGATLRTLGTGLLILLVVIVIWSLIWKGIALWKSARKNHLLWFVILLLVNTLGILEILYIFIFSKLGEAKAETRKKKR